MKILDQLVDYDNEASVGNSFRDKRFSFFKSKIAALNKPMKILDIGGTFSYWSKRGFQDNPDYHITLVNIKSKKLSCENIITVEGDATNLVEFPDNHFDLVYSNSVIEHLFTEDNQVKMANEVKRLSKYHFIQTPNLYFPIEPHYLIPFFQFLPFQWRLFIITKTKLSKGKKVKDIRFAKKNIREKRLLSLKQFKSMFPNSKIYKEKFYGINKSFVAHNLPD
ncbi:MAG: class I SAM-dependent methyltransferase [Tunicatimonas sp.]|uniref:class I SAM-dependent methyltransferase n=1 Tax=Tunicatimonas sp. TaxID=1940096 RepID=UPI003C74E015